jgi:excisionase family DNA binding protein
MSTGYLSVKEASEILGYSEQYVRKLLRSGELSGELTGNGSASDNGGVRHKVVPRPTLVC